MDKRKEQLEKKFANLHANTLDNQQPDDLESRGKVVYLNLFRKLKNVIEILEKTSTNSLDNELDWLSIEELCVLADDQDGSATFQGDKINGWLMEIGHEYDPYVDGLSSNCTDTKFVYHWESPYDTDRPRQHSRLIRWNQLYPVLSTLKYKLSRKFKSAHFFMCDADLRNVNIDELCNKLKKSFVRRFVDLCYLVGIHNHRQHVIRHHVNENSFLGLKKRYYKIFESDFPYVVRPQPTPLHEVPLSLIQLHRGLKTDVNTCWFNSCLRILSTIKEVFSKFVFEVVWQRQELCGIRYNSLLQGDNLPKVKEFLDIVFQRHRQESINLYERLFQVLMSTFFKEQHKRCNRNLTVFTSGLLSIYMKLYSLKREFQRSSLHNLDKLAPNEYASFVDQLQNMISFLGHDLKSLFTIHYRPATYCVSCKTVVYRDGNHGVNEFLVYEMAAVKGRRHNLKDIVFDETKFDFDPDIPRNDDECSHCGQNVHLIREIIDSTSQYFMVHPFGERNATAQPLFSLDNELMVPNYQNNSNEINYVEYKLKAFVAFKGEHFTTYFAIEGNDNFWIFHDDNKIPRLEKRELTKEYPVELAIYERRGEGRTESRDLFPHETRIFEATLEEIEHQMQTEERKRKSQLQRTTNSKKKKKAVQVVNDPISKIFKTLDEYKGMVERHGDLGPLVLAKMNSHRLPGLMVLNENEHDPFIDECEPEFCLARIVEDLTIDSPVRVEEVTAEEVLFAKSVHCNSCDESCFDMAKVYPCNHATDCRRCLLKWMSNTIEVNDRGRYIYNVNCSQCPYCKEYIDGMQILSHTERLQISQDNIEVGTLVRERVVNDALCERICRPKGAFDKFFIHDVIDAFLSRSENSVLRRWDCTNDLWFTPNFYYCSLPTFIWRSLNAVHCTVLSTYESVNGTAPRNRSNIEAVSECYVHVDLITNGKWPRFGERIPVRIGFAFTLVINRCRALDLGVWENTTEPAEWEMGYLDNSKNFWKDYKDVKEVDFLRTIDDENDYCHPFYYLLSRVVQVMTGNLSMVSVIY